MATERFWHSGVHLRGARGAPVVAPTRGHIFAARRAEGDARASSRSFVLIRHDLDVDGEPITFYSVLAHLSLPQIGSPEANGVPWLQEVSHGDPKVRARLAAGEVVTLNQRVEAGAPVGHVGTVSRGPEQGPEVHIQIFTTDRLGRDFGHDYHYVTHT